MDDNSAVCSKELSWLAGNDCKFKKAAISPVLAAGFEKLIHGLMYNYLDKLKMIAWNTLDITCKN